MARPEDIPQDVWDQAFEHMDCHCPEAMMDSDELQQSVHAAIARAIMAAKAEERRACLEAALGEQLDGDTDDDTDRAYMRAINDAAAAIRKREG